MFQFGLPTSSTKVVLRWVGACHTVKIRESLYLGPQVMLTVTKFPLLSLYECWTQRTAFFRSPRERKRYLHSWQILSPSTFTCERGDLFLLASHRLSWPWFVKYFKAL